MHREVRQGKKVNAIIISLLAITFALYIYQYSKLLIGHKDEILVGVSIFLILGTLFVLFKEVKKCKISYKYSIISDKLIINKIKDREESNVENLRMTDILYIGERKNMPKEYIKGKLRRHYIRNLNKNKKLICIYRKNDKINKFMFEPSCTLEERIKNII